MLKVPIGYQEPDMSINWTFSHVMLVIEQDAPFSTRESNQGFKLWLIVQSVTYFLRVEIGFDLTPVHELERLYYNACSWRRWLNVI